MKDSKLNLNRRNLFDILTVMLFTGLIYHSRQSPDTLGWTVLFLVIILNALFFILKKPIVMISWFVIVISILGIIMSMPAMIETGIAYANSSSTTTDLLKLEKWHPALYFMITFLFSLVQIQRFGNY